MEDLKRVIADNMILLRKRNKLTQIELADKLNYSDKSVSKWERGESVPDIIVLKQLADMYSVSVDYFLNKHDSNEKVKNKIRISKNKRIIILLSVLGIWFLGTFSFFCAWSMGHIIWLIFVACVPITLIDLIVFNTLWGNRKNNLFYISGLIWTSLAFIYLLLLSKQLYLIFTIGVPAQAAAILSFHIKPPKKKTDKNPEKVDT